MKSIRNHALLPGLALGVLVSCLGAGVAKAQAIQGKFTLPAEVRWGMATLQPGDYTFTSEGVQAGYLVRVKRDGNAVALLQAQAYDPSTTGPSALVIQNGKSGSVVREVRLPKSGLVLYYAPHKPKRGTAAAEREVAQLIPIADTATR